jgi:hypothetical protein
VFTPIFETSSRNRFVFPSTEIDEFLTRQQRWIRIVDVYFFIEVSASKNPRQSEEAIKAVRNNE